MIKVSVDQNRCQGYGNCVSAEPDVFDLDESGLAFAREEEMPDGRLGAMRAAAVVCPVDAILVAPRGRNEK